MALSMNSAGSSTSSLSTRKIKLQKKRKREEEENIISTEMCPLWDTTHNLDDLVDVVYDFVEKKVGGGRTTNVWFSEDEWQAMANKIEPVARTTCDKCKQKDHKLSGKQVSTKVTVLKRSGSVDLTNLCNRDSLRKKKWEFIAASTEKKSVSEGASSRSKSGGKRKTCDPSVMFAEAVVVLAKLHKEKKITDSEFASIASLMIVEDTDFVERVCITLTLAELTHKQMASTLKKTLTEKKKSKKK